MNRLSSARWSAITRPFRFDNALSRDRGRAASEYLSLRSISKNAVPTASLILPKPCLILPKLHLAPKKSGAGDD